MGAKGGRRCEPIERKAIRAEFCDGIAAPARLACCAGKRCAFPQFRTLPGSNPGVGIAKSPLPGGQRAAQFKWCPQRDIRVRLRRPLPLRRFAPCVLRWKTLRVSSAPHPAGFESRRMGSKKARYREGNGLLKLNGAPSGIRTRDIHLERVASLAARRWGQRS